MKLNGAVVSATLLSLFFGLPASAHHSFAMFDRGQTASIAGTVKTFEMINPHGWLTLLVADQQGQTSEWALETGGAGQLARGGWQQQSVRPGDKVVVTLHPLRDGSKGGQLISVTLPSGQVLNTGPGRNRGAPGGGPEE